MNRRIAVTAWLGALTLAVCGCGSATGTSSTNAPSGSQTAATMDAVTTTTSGSTSDGGSTAADQISAYLSSFNTIRREGHGAERKFKAAAHGLSNSPDQTWVTTGDAVLEFSDKLTGFIPKVAALTPPASLKQANTQYLTALKQIQVSLQAFGTDLKNKDATAASADAAKVQTASANSRAELLRFRYAVQGACRTAGISVPGWVNKVGS